eukprot:GCRY01000487.1.p1 GENE.GCRY01000487.1~~GCRY01000487.1.p1  ORF type:complete len:390 (+),score=104.99 GCRY01000487.1:119-1288(+)
MMKLLFVALCLVLGTALAEHCTPHPNFDPIPYTPNVDAGFIGHLTPNTLLNNETVKNFVLPAGWTKPETVIVHRSGHVFTGMENGDIVRIHKRVIRGTCWFCPEFMKYKVIANTGGRPLGLAFSRGDHGLLYIADAHKGLMSLNILTGRLSLLANQTTDGQTINYANFVSVSRHGTVYMTDCTVIYPLLMNGAYQTFYSAILDMLDAHATGRLIEYNPRTGVASVVTDGLFYANGVALSHNEDFAVVAETGRYMLTKVSLQQHNFGEKSNFSEPLPYIPDNVMRGPDNTFWVGSTGYRMYDVDALQEDVEAKWEFACNIAVHIAPYGLVVQYNEEGEVVRSLHDPTGESYYDCSSAYVKGSKMYLGSVVHNIIGVVDLDLVEEMAYDEE